MLIEYPASSSVAAGAEQRHRNHNGRDDGVADVLQEQEHHNEHQHHRLDQRREHLLDRGLHHRRDVIGNVIGDIGGKEPRQLLHLGFDRASGGKRIAGWRQQHRKTRGRLAVEPRGELIAHAADFDPGDIAHPDGRAVGIGAQDDRAEFIRRTQLAFHEYERRYLLLRRARFGADTSRCDLCVLGIDRLGHVVRRQAVADKPGGIDPDPQRALGGIKRSPPDAGDAPDLAEHVPYHEIAKPNLIEAVVGGPQRDDLQHRARGFLDQNALLDDGARQPRFDPLDAILDLDRRQAGVGARHEIGCYLDLAQRVAGGFEIQDPGGAVQLLLDQPRHAVVEIFRRRARIAGADRDRGRRDDRILRDRKQRNRDRTDQADEQRDDPGEDRPVNEEAGHCLLTG
jgi:hypothetical protein